MLIRGITYALTVSGILVVLGIVMNIIFSVCGVNIQHQDFVMMMVIFTIFGMGGSLISLFLSKYLCKKSMHVQIIEVPRTEAEKWLVNTVEKLAKRKGVGMPEVGVYSASEMNAFATGPNRNSALVAVSTGLLEKMEEDEIEAVLGHEMSHVANGDMVTQCLLQGVVNTFVYAISFIIASAIAGATKSRNSSNSSFRFINYLLQIFFGFLGSLVVLWFSRYREYKADAGSADVLGKEPMIKALQALQSQVVEKKSDNVKALCIAGSSSLSELFMTHPPLEKRIAALKSYKRIR